MKNIHKKIISTLNKYRDSHDLDVKEISRKLQVFEFYTELRDKYGLSIKPCSSYSMDWQNFGDFVTLGLYGGRREISWEDNDKPTPNGRYLIRFSFCTGAYIFGGGFGDDDYPIEFFQRFWHELRAYNPDYIDTANKSLYFELGNAAKLFNDFPSILERYNAENQIDRKKRKAEKLRRELEKLENV